MIRDVLSEAIAMHQAGHLNSAVGLYQQVLAQEQHNPEALNLLGVLHLQRGENARAAEAIGLAVTFRPDAPNYHVNLAEAYRRQGQFERAATSCRLALQLSPDHPEALSNLGLALQGLGRPAEAAEQFHRALLLRPDFTAAHSNLGMVLRELGQREEALRHFRRAVELSPENALARSNLGQCLLDSGRIEEALPHCQEAARLEPGLAPMHHNLGNTLRALDRFSEARSAYLEAFRLDPSLARSAAHLGQMLRKSGELDAALTWLKRAAELEPRVATHWEELAELHDQREEFSEAIPCLERVLELKPKRASAHNHLGRMLQKQERSAEAAEHYRAALRLRPRSAVSHLHLAWLHQELGELAEAEAACREAIRLQPTFHLPHARLGILLRGRLPEADLAALEQRLDDPKLLESTRSRLLFALAYVLDERGDYARAALCLREANALALGLAPRRRKRAYDPAEHERFVEHLIQSFPQEWFTRLAGAGFPTRRPVFVFGLPRSGTTLVEQILASHRRVHGGGELRLVRQTFDAIPIAMGRAMPPMDCLPHIDAVTIRRLAERHDERMRSLAANGADRIVDKMPENYIFLGLLAVLFPQAVFIHCRRDQRDVALSCWQTDFHAIPWAHDTGHIAHRILQYNRLMEHWRTVLPVSMHEVDYEEVVSDLEGTTRRLLATCGLEWDPACLEFHRTSRPVRTASVTQVRRPIYTSSVGRWKNYALALDDLFAAIPPDSR